MLQMPRAAKIQMTPPTRSVSAVTTRYVNLTPGIRLSSLACNANETSLELDSHADTCVVGEKALIIADYCRPVTVHAYDKELGERTYRTVSAVVGYTCPSSGATYHLVIHQAIEIPHLEHHLLCPMQCRVNDVVVNDVPKFLSKNVTPETHAIVVDSVAPQDGSSEALRLVAPLSIMGVTSYLPVHRPSREEYDSGEIPRFELTSATLTWDPSSTTYMEQEDSQLDVSGGLASIDPRDRGHTLVINSFSSCTHSPLADITHDDNFGNVLLSKVQVSAVKKKAGTVGSTQGKLVDAQALSRRWMIPLHRAKNTVRKTTQRGVRKFMSPNRAVRFPTNDRMLRYRRLPHDLYTDTLIAGTVSKRGNKNAQVYGTSFGWCRAHPMERKSQAHETVSLLFKRDGVPPAMIMDNSKEQLSTEFRRKLREADCHHRTIEPYSPWSNAAEMNIRELKRGASRKMLRSHAPKKLWDHCLELEAFVRSCTAHDHYALNGEVPETVMKGQPADISNICEYEWYQWVMYLEPDVQFPDDKWKLGRYLGPATDVGSMMTSKILNYNGNYVPRSTFRPLTEAEMANPDEQEARRQFDLHLESSLGKSAVASDFSQDDLTPEYELYEDNVVEGSPDDADCDKEIPHYPDDSPAVEIPTPEASDNYVGAEVQLPLGDTLARGRVIERKRDANGDAVGRANANPIKDTREYKVEFETGEVTELTANVIAESMYAMCDENGESVLLFDSIVDHRKDDTALNRLTATFHDKDGRQYQRRNTKGWQVCCQWKDGSTSWEKLSDFKECYPVQTAEYAVTQGIDDEPAFNWWVPQVLKKRDRIISLVQRRQTRYLKKTHKFGIELPKTVEEALALDKKNNNNLWAEAIAKEMKNVKVAFDILPNGEQAPRNYTQIRCHMIFDVKMEDFRRKARLVAGGHMTETPKCMTYSSVVGRETVRLALTIAALNDLEVKAGDIMNAYVTAPITEKVWTVLGPEWGADAGKKAIVVRALYGLKSAGAAFRKHLADCMRTLGYQSCLADHDLWYKPVQKADGTEYYSYILCYVDDILVIHHDPMPILNKIDKFFALKPDSVGDPDMYLGTKLRRHLCPNGVWSWTMSPSKYVQEAVNNCEKYLSDNFDGKYSLPKVAPNPFAMGYEPELDDSTPLEPDAASYFQSIIGVLRWMCEIGRIDINTEVSILSSFLAYPREGHLEAACHIMGYLKHKHNSRMFLDPSDPGIDPTIFNDGVDWSEFYGDVEEAIPPNAYKPLGKEVDIRMMVDSDHAGDKAIRPMQGTRQFAVPALDI